MKIHALNSLVLKRWRLDRRKPQREICIRPKNKRILHCFALNTELQRISTSRVRATLIQEQRKDPFLSMIDKLLTAEAVGKQLAQKQSDARSPSTSNQVFVKSKEDMEMIDLTMDDEENADGEAHTASTPNCRATPHHLNVA